ncbi:ABC transporter substrate-binding protein [Oceanimonas baumannii]|uniref:Iron complex transport system substrate-binding protein n=1 Tax=Oceanimonas baumannii TaxID=129578 RepID=A0A235CEC5_9GAMM|nr:ABC transporter substrate-binding protein [Oceanimonas baumannii]OYD22769.1 hypothetical protein B6S09_14975 [Oceanimonas baumannii]TDW57735.1 iron complex transport system substrate-binding protein [Oceanimonas baumannii]
MLFFLFRPMHTLPGVVLLCWSLTAWPVPRVAVLDPGHAEIARALGMEQAIVLLPVDPALSDGFSHAQHYRHRPAIESLLALEPDVVIGGNPVRDQVVIEQSQRFALSTHMLVRTLPVDERIHALAGILGVPGRGQELVWHMQQDYARAAELAQGRPPVRVLHLSSNGAGAGNVTGAGAGTPAHGLIERAGGMNVGAETGLERYQVLSAEGVMLMAPEVVVVSDLELAALGGLTHIWQRVPGLGLTPAARQRRLVVLEHSALKFDAAGSGRATLALARALHQP